MVIGGAGLIGSHTVDQLLHEDVREIVIYDNFVRGRSDNLAGALNDPRVRIFEIGGDIMQTDILERRSPAPTAYSTLRRSGCCNVTSFRAAPSM